METHLPLRPFLAPGTPRRFAKPYGRNGRRKRSKAKLLALPHREGDVGCSCSGLARRVGSYRPHAGKRGAGDSALTLFSTRTHGVLDYTSVVLLLALPRVAGWSKPVTHLLTGSALATLAYSLLTRYELGAVRLLPVPAHLALDRTSGIALCAAGGMMGDELPTVRAALVGLGLFEVFASLTTERQPRA